MSWALSGNVSLMQVCLFGGRATTFLPTAQLVSAPPLGNNSPRFQELSNHSLQIPLGSDNRPCIAKAYGAQAQGRLHSVPGKWAVLPADIVEKTAEHGDF